MIRIAFLSFLLLFCGIAQAETHTFYFSDDATGNPAGDDTTGSGTQISPWKSLAKAKTIIDTLPVSDTVYLYFDRSDDWTWDSAQSYPSDINEFVVDATDPVVHIDAYGTGSKPVFDGLVTNFNTAAVPDAINGPLAWSRFFEIKKDGCSISNVEIKRVYANGIYLNDADNFTLSNSDFNNFGKSAIQFNRTYGLTGSTVEYCVMHTGQELERAGLSPGTWGSAIQFGGNGGSARVYNNHVHHNTIYNIYGEGMHIAGSTVEYNLIGDTGSVAIDASAFQYNYENTVVRYNFIIFSDRTTSIYDGLANGERSGIRVFDEYIGGTNSGATVDIYGNTITNYDYGISMKCTTGVSDECGNPVGTLRVYNNTFIDNVMRNIRLVHPLDVAINAHVYNNASILYDRTTGTHVSDNSELPATGWTISNNAFWTTGGSPVVDSNWQTNYVITDPQLAGEPATDWDGQTGATYFTNIQPADVTPAGSLIDAGMTLPAGYSYNLLTSNTTLDTDPTASVWELVDQRNYGAWDIGAMIVASGKPSVSASVTQHPAEIGNVGIVTITCTEAVSSDCDSLPVYYTVGGTASAGDYTAGGSSPLTVPSQAVPGTIEFTAVDDSDDDDDETIIVTITSNAGYAIGSPTATLVIADDDVPQEGSGTTGGVGTMTLGGSGTITLR